MLFNSFEYAVFLAVVVGLYAVLARRGQNAMLLVASYVFYGWWDWRFLSLIAASTLLDFGCARGIAAESASPRRRRALLAASLAGNLGILGFFKYYDFFAASAAALLERVGLPVEPQLLGLVLPVGISFYTFQTLGYTIDVYRRQIAPCRRLGDFALYVAFFPQLVAGPIERAGHLLPQIERPRRVTRAGFYEGGWLIFWGLYKKVFVADNLAPFVDRVYAAPGDATGLDVLLATYAFAIQIYCDFSGYTDIARGTARWLGFDLMENFRLPYFATDPRDFWRRWHISLSRWLRDYLYIPLGGNRAGRARRHANLMATMALGGLWHGAAWNFVAWGIYHGALLVVYRVVGWARGEDATARGGVENGATRGATRGARWRRVGAIALMFHLTCLGWLLFRADGMGTIAALLGRLATDWSASAATVPMLLALAGTAAVLVPMQVAQHRTDDAFVVRRFPVAVRVALYVIMYLSITIGGAFDGQAFIYFQF